ncbi:hypothetical protein PVAND_010561 [Polypedilum vanderplanki]|uniref:Tudor domain-containing protein n=1 Tax=Polypedilum vanderplanki TaxID=319348 RepID=A0A9J6CGT8_POLVA|nr:hypothetical protein PVAND_010561 [Polypedilum vanderplanki]
MNQLHTCGNCHNEANLLCSRCQYEYYCSKSCQIIDFSRHRALCFGLPPLIKKDVQNNCLMPNTNVVSAIKPTTVEVVKAIESEKHSLPEKLLPPPPKCIPDPPLLEKISRMSVASSQKCNPNPIVNKQEQKQSQKIVPAFDQGIRTTAPSEYKKPPSLITTTKAVEKPKEISQEDVVTPVIRRNQQTILTERPIIVKPKEVRVFIDEIDYRLLGSIGDKVRVTAVNGNLSDNLLYVTELNECIEEYMNHIDENIKKYIEKEKSTSYKPRKNEVVLAKFEGEFYRAVVEDVKEGDPNTYTVFFIDYGNRLKNVKEEDMKCLGSKLKNEMVLHTIKISNLPKTITGDVGRVFESQNGFEIEILKRDESTGIYTVRACAL